MKRPRLGTALALLALLSACDSPLDSAGLELGTAVNLLATTRGELAEQALRRVLLRGRIALPYLEAALHSAQPAGRRNLVAALTRLGLDETAPLLGHIAAYDGDLDTAAAAARTLRLWASRPSPRGRAAAAALIKVDEVRGSGALLLDP
jgi:hypothetical protein